MSNYECPRCDGSRPVQWWGKMPADDPAPYDSDTCFCVSCHLYFHRNKPELRVESKYINR